jgi:uncharacterized protein
MTNESIALICLAIALVAFLYSSVGHAGASGYIAVMSLFGLTTSIIKPSALVLNILVASLTSWQFWQAGHFSWKLFAPFAALAVPLAFLGGYFNLPPSLFKILVGIVLIFSAIRFIVTNKSDDEEILQPSTGVSVAIGGGLGLLAGLTATGGGIFLTPVLLFNRWATTKTAAAVSALFILANSIAGLGGNYLRSREIPFVSLSFAIAALVGGAGGSYLGSHKLSPTLIKKLLAIVLLIAGVKLLFT